MTIAWVAGGTGLVGKELVRMLLEDDAYSSVVCVGRRRLDLTSPKLRQEIVDFGDPRTFDGLPAPDVALSCLGTTMKKAGSREAFRAVDYDAVVAFARAAQSKGARVLVHVSSLGADARSPSFYARVKGEVEAALAELGFESVYAMRPSILDGDRDEQRPLERIGIAAARALAPVLGKYRPTPATAVARAMIAKAEARAPGAHVVSAEAIR